MSTFGDLIQRQADRIVSPHKLDNQDFQFMINWIKYATPRYARILGKTLKNTDDVSKNYSDEYLINIYDNGYDKDPTAQNLIGHSLDIKEFFTKTQDDPDMLHDPNGDTFAQRVRVVILPDNTCVILPPLLPRDFGQYKVLMLLDASNPGIAWWDYPRFSI